MKCELLLSRRDFLKLGGAALACMALPLGIAEGGGFGVPVLLYHDISHEHDDEYTMAPGLFAAQMEWLYANGYETLSFRDFAGSAGNRHDRSVIITFDDGYASFMEYAFPLLKDYGFRANINIIGRYAGRCIDFNGERPMLSWDEYRFLAASGLIELGCHTYDLHNFSHRGVIGVPAEALENDLRLFRVTFMKEIGGNCGVLAWPYGLYDEKSVAVAKKAGFEYLLTSNRGFLAGGGSLSEIPRLNIGSRLNLLSFEKYIGESV